MIGLSSALSTAQAALATNAALSSVVSRNIAGVNDPSYTRRIANLATAQNGAAAVTSISRATDDALFRNLLSSTSDAAASQALSDGLNRLEATTGLSSTAAADGTTVGANAPAALIATLTQALDQYAASPGDTASGQAVLAAAKSLTSSLAAASATVGQVRADADRSVASAVSDVNALLGQFQVADAAVVKGTALGSDVTDALDSRDKILTSLSQYLGVSTIVGSDGGMSIYTDSGATLFQDVPRQVSFAASNLAGGASPQSVLVDGVPVAGSNAVMPLRSGSIAGLVQLRDTATVSYQDQLDQIAGGLVSAFAETDQTGGSAPTVAGLFTWSGAPAVPSSGATGVAASLKVNPNVDPSQGGVLTRLRDGGIGDPTNSAYVANTTSAAGFSAHIQSLLANLDGTRSFDATSGGAAHATLAGYAASSVSWLEASRKIASDTATDRSAVVTQTTSSLSSKTGVNLDDQLSRMLDLEHAYQASAELMSTVKGMYDSLLSAIQ